MWLIYSGCGEEQTSADAMFSGRANGAFTYFDLKSFNVNTTNKDELTQTRYLLQKYSFEQIPELSAQNTGLTKQYLFDKMLIFFGL